MTSAGNEPIAALKAFLALGRVSNLPTVWSNCLAGWLLGGGGETEILWRLCLGATCLYLGGVFLNDAVDVAFDREYRPERPIPSGAVSEQSVWFWAIAWLGTGLLALSGLGTAVQLVTYFLLTSIVLYSLVHKRVSFAPLLMALCRFLLLLLGAAAGAEGWSGLVLWFAIALGLYIASLSWIARGESGSEPVPFWPVPFLMAPLVLGLLVNDGVYRARGVFVAAILGLWLIRSLRLLAAKPGAAVASLLAGIPLVDTMAVVGVHANYSDYIVVFPVLLIVACALQRLAPAT